MKNNYILINSKFIKRADLTIYEKNLYLIMQSYSAERGYCYNNLTQISRDLQITKNTLLKYLKNLEEKGGLYICNRFDKNNKLAQLTNKYYVISLDSDGEFDKNVIEKLKELYPDKKIYE